MRGLYRVFEASGWRDRARTLYRDFRVWESGADSLIVEILTSP